MHSDRIKRLISTYTCTLTNEQTKGKFSNQNEKQIPFDRAMKDKEYRSSTSSSNWVTEKK